MQTAVKNKYENDDGPGKTYRDLSGVVSKRTINQWIKMINNIGSIDLSRSPVRSRTAQTKANISKVKWCLAQKKRVSTKQLTVEMNISKRSVQRRFRKDFE